MTTQSEQERQLRLDAEVARLLAAPTPPSLQEKSPPAKSWVEIPVYYATRREETNSADPAEAYGGRDDTLKYGRAIVTIPERYRPGREDTRGLCRLLPGRLGCRRGPANSVTVAARDRFSAADWLTAVHQEVGDADTVDALVYVHGYNNSFADAVKRAAELAYDIGFPGIPFTFDWASRNNIPSYVVDQETAERSSPDFAKFLRRIVDSTGARHVAIIAHSMGTRLVSYALRDVGDEASRLRVRPVVFAASDIDSAIFVQQLAAAVARTGHPVTLYASSRDRVIRLSADVVHAARRVGSGPPALILADGIDYVDASTVDTDLLGHGYFAENKELIDDIFMAVRLEAAASRRNLSAIVVGPQQVYYRLK